MSTITETRPEAEAPVQKKAVVPPAVIGLVAAFLVALGFAVAFDPDDAKAKDTPPTVATYLTGYPNVPATGYAAAPASVKP